MSKIGFTEGTTKSKIDPNLLAFQQKIVDDDEDKDEAVIDISTPSKSMKEICGIIDEEIVGQVIAKKTVFRVLERVKFDLTRVLERNGDRNKAIATLFFAGPTGVGKTQMAKSMQKALNIMFDNNLQLVKINCADFLDPQGHGLSQLKGATMGYIGCNSKATLHPDNIGGMGRVILFDEIEKGGAPLWNLLLAILDDGVLDINYLKEKIQGVNPYPNGDLVKSNGDKIENEGKLTEEEENIVKAYFKDSVIVMTSNLGTAKIQKMLKGSIGFVNDSKDASQINKEMQEIINEALKENSRPEFQSRVNHIIPFSFLTIEEYREILDRFISLMVTNLLQDNGGMNEKSALLEITDSARDYITYEVFTKYGDKGVRALPTYIQDTIVAALAKAMGDDAFGNMDKVLKVKIVGGNLAYRIVDIENCDLKNLIEIKPEEVEEEVENTKGNK